MKENLNSLFYPNLTEGQINHVFDQVKFLLIEVNGYRKKIIQLEYHYSSVSNEIIDGGTDHQGTCTIK